MPLSDLQIRRLKPATSVQRIADGQGLYLKISPSGTKTWMYRSQSGGDHWVVIGKYPAMSLLDARNHARMYSAGSVSMTVKQAYDQYLPYLRRAMKRPEQAERRFERDILPTLGTKRLVQLKRVDVSSLLQSIVNRGSPVAANRTLPDIKHLLDFCVEKGWLQSNPATGITRKAVGGKEHSRERVLTHDELVGFIKVLKGGFFEPRTRMALWFLLLTGQRTSEVLGLHKSELSRQWWTIPAKRTKTKREQKVYLAPAARAVLKIALRKHTPMPFAMDRRTPGRAVSRVGFDPPFTPHDFRRTMSTRLSDMGIAPHVVEKMLNHKFKGTMAVYNLAEYLPERRAAWQLWGRYLTTIRRRSDQSPAATAASS